MKKRTKKFLCAALAATLCVPMAAGQAFGASGKTPDVEVGMTSRVESASTEAGTADSGKANLKAFKTLPKKFDLRDNDVVTPVKDQSPFGTCWTFGASAAAESSILTDIGMTNKEFSEKYFDLDLAEKHLAYWSTHGVEAGNYEHQDGEGRVLLRDVSASDTYVGGTDLIAMELYSSGVGPILEEECKYEFYDASGNLVTDSKKTDTVTRESWESPKSLGRTHADFEFTDGNLLPIYRYDGENANDTAKKELLRGRGLAVAYKADVAMPGEDPENLKYMNRTTWAQCDDENTQANHCVCIVGWDDNFSKNNFNEGHKPEKDGAWIAKNSWGDGWGINGSGYFYLSYYDKSISALETFDFDMSDRAFTDNTIIDQYDYLPSQLNSNGDDVVEFKSANTELKMANVFTARTSQDICSVGVDTAYPNSRLTIEVYVDPTDGKPESGILVDRKIATEASAGFHRINLNGEYHVSKGQKFSIVVKEQAASDEGMKYVAHAGGAMSKELAEKYNETAAEEERVYNYGNAVINAGESWMDIGNGWVDWSTKWSQYATGDNEGCVYDNFSIKAFSHADPEANTMKVSAKAKTVKASALKKKAQTVAPITVSSAKGKVSYAVAGGNAASKKALTLNKKNGKITVKKGTKKGTYTLKVKVTAAGNDEFLPASKTVSATVKVK